MNSQKEKAQGNPPVKEKAPVAKTKFTDETPPDGKPVLSLEEITEALGTMEEATAAFKVAEKRKNAAAELAFETEELAKAEKSKVRSAEARASYVEAQATILKNDRIVAEETALKNEREAQEALEAEVKEAERLASEEAAKVELEAGAKTRRDAGEYEPMIGEQVGDVFLQKEALDLGSVGVILRIVPLDKAGGKTLGLPEHLFIPLVKPVNGLLRRSKR